MSILVMDDDFRARCKNLREWAHLPENYYIAPEDQSGPPPAGTPGYNPNHRMQNGRYRIVYSVTVAPDRSQYRHLSVSVPGNKLPNTTAVFTVAAMLGFTGGGLGPGGIVEHPGDDWQIGVKEEECCVVVAQQMARPPIDASHLKWGGK